MRLLVLASLLVACSSRPAPDAPLENNGIEADLDGGDPGLGASLEAGDVAAMGDSKCSPDLTGIVRDFNDDHPDFENDAFMSDTGETNIVEPMLGADFKPVYRPGGRLTTGKSAFNQWYRDTPGVNQSFPLKLTFAKGSGSVMTYENEEFFPADGQGFGAQGRAHNFHFTFELHTEFVYRGGEVFTFTGDDDLWVFVNGRLAIDLGGLHPKLTSTLRLDERAGELALTPGKTYGLSVFHAERHTTASRFRIDTTIEFTNCSPIVR